MAGKRKATDEQLLSAYAEYGSIWAVADKFQMCGQSVHERLTKLNAIHQWKWTPEEDRLLVTLYEKAGDNRGFLDELEKIFKRHKTNICTRAKKLHLTNKNRKSTEITIAMLAEGQRQRIAKNGHPRGFLGKNHSVDAKAIIAAKSRKSAAIKTEEDWEKRARKSNLTRASNGTKSTDTENAYSRTVSGKRKDLGCFFRSKTEANFARFLNAVGIRWEYEPKVFFFDGITKGILSYTPDFYCPDNDGWYEVKGWLDGPSLTRMRRFKRYYPEEADKLVIVAQSKKTYKQALDLGYDVMRYEEIEKAYKTIPNWE
jgi:hypothetical protein